MEREVAEFISMAVNRPQQLPLMDKTADELIDEFEVKEVRHLGNAKFKLNRAQREAVKCSFENSLALLLVELALGRRQY